MFLGEVARGRRRAAGYARQQRMARVTTKRESGAVLILLSVADGRNEMVDRVARYRFG